MINKGGPPRKIWMKPGNREQVSLHFYPRLFSVALLGFGAIIGSVMDRLCDVCCVPYVAQRRTSRYCSGRCRVRACRAGLSGPGRPVRRVDLVSSGPSALVQAVTAELERVGRLDSAYGVMALALARALSSSSYVSGSSVAAMSRELIKVMDIAVEDALVGPDLLDEVRRRREGKRLSR
jgi:hypothetical protein